MIDFPPQPPAIVQPAPENPFAKYGGAPGQLNPFVRYGGIAVPAPQPGRLQFIDKLRPLFERNGKWRYKVLEGGRGGVKSWGIARALLIIGQQEKLRIVCGREFMSSIKDSVYQLLVDQIADMGLGDFYKVFKSRIIGLNGTEIRFVGLGDMTKGAARTKMKSMERVDILWVEEAETVGKETWQALLPTIRAKNSEIWISYNPNLETDSTYERFHINTPPKTLRIVLNWRENPWMPQVLIDEKDWLFRVDPEAAAHVWDGLLRKHAEAAILRGKVVVHNFDTPADVVFRHGADFGYAADPSTLIRSYITGTPGKNEELWIDWEEWELHCDIDVMPTMYDKCPTARRWPIKGDSGAPQVISYLARQGFAMTGAEKWDGSVDDGIAHLRGFSKIHIHKDKCPHTALEAQLYRWKTDKISGLILPIVIDKHNHCWDAVRYSLDGHIQRRGVAGVWARLGKKTLGPQ